MGGHRSLQEGTAEWLLLLSAALATKQRLPALPIDGCSSHEELYPKHSWAQRGEGARARILTHLTFQATCHLGPSSLISKLLGVTLLPHDKSRLSSCPDPTTLDWMLQAGPSGGSPARRPKEKPGTVLCSRLYS